MVKHSGCSDSVLSLNTSCRDIYNYPVVLTKEQQRFYLLNTPYLYQQQITGLKENIEKAISINTNKRRNGYS